MAHEGQEDFARPVPAQRALGTVPSCRAEGPNGLEPSPGHAPHHVSVQSWSWLLTAGVPGRVARGARVRLSHGPFLGSPSCGDQRGHGCVDVTSGPLLPGHRWCVQVAGDLLRSGAGNGWGGDPVPLQGVDMGSQSASGGRKSVELQLWGAFPLRGREAAALWLEQGSPQVLL